jgi:hypothetical protein
VVEFGFNLLLQNLQSFKMMEHSFAKLAKPVQGTQFSRQSKF